MAKPDNRADNVDHLQQAINHTMENLREAENYIAAHANEMNQSDVEDIKNKNARREDAIEGFRSEIKDEAAHQQNS